MKLLISIFALLIIGGTKADSHDARLDGGKANFEANILTWQNIETYIFNTASKDDPLVREMLHAEAVLGIKTWSLNFFSTALGGRDGGAVGWPSTGKTISFPTSEQASICADMIDEFTFWAHRRQR
jgi:hypothetical protein